MPSTLMAQQDADIDHVLLISVDGMHGSDLDKLRTVLPGGNLVRLMDHGVTYEDARCSAPSDSQPGLVALVTGGTPKSSGCFYDLSYSRTLYAPGATTPGCVCEYDEVIEFNDSLLDGGGGIDPAKLPLTAPLADGGVPVYPHNYLRDNTIFEAIKAAGGRTCWSDKSWGYEFVEGPSGHGCDDVFFPEITSGPVYTTSIPLVEQYDTIKVNAVLDWIHGLNHDGSTPAGGKKIPAICGMNFQAISVGQKLVIGGVAQGGYSDAAGNPMTPGMIGCFQFVDSAIGQFVDALKAEHVYDHTLIVISAKHGQAPIDPKKTMKIGDQISPIVGNRAAQITEDDVALIWLTPSAQPDAAQVVSDLLQPANVAAAHIKHVIWGNEIAALYRNPKHDDRTPDIIVVPEEGVIYSTSKAKQAEHGGFNEDDRHVGMLLANPHLHPGKVDRQVFTTQIAPTILWSLGIDPFSLKAVQEEGTRVLPGLIFRDHDDHFGPHGDG
jgi:hypothetical protein